MSAERLCATAQTRPGFLRMPILDTIVPLIEWLDQGDVSNAAFADDKGRLIENSSCPLFVTSIEDFPAPCIFGRNAIYRSGLLMPWTVIGRYATIAHHVDIGVPAFPDRCLTAAETAPTLNLHPRDDMPPPLTIVGCDVWIGGRASVLQGVKVGHGAVIAPGTSVQTDVPPYAIVAGNPAEVTGYRFSDQIIRRLLDAAWWRLSPERVAALPTDTPEAVLEMLEAA